MAFMLTSAGLRSFSESRTSKTARTGGVLTAAVASGIAAARVPKKGVVAGASVAVGAAGLFLVPKATENPLARGMAEGLLASGVAQVGALLGGRLK